MEPRYAPMAVADQPSRDGRIGYPTHRHHQGDHMTANTAQLAATLASLAAMLAEQQIPEPEPEPGTREIPDRVLLTVEEAAHQLGIGRTKVYALVKSGDLESVQIGRLRRIPTAAIEEYAARLVARTNA